MVHKKGKFLNFCFSCIPGAGQMYQGFMKRGVSIMLIFFGMLALISYLGIDELIFCLPVIWCYGFFDGIHLNSLPDSEYEQLQDEYLFINVSDKMPQIRLKKLRIPAAVVLILFGSYSLFRTVINFMIYEGFLFWDSPVTNLVYDSFPKVLFSVLIIVLGIYLIIGKKKEMEEYEENVYQKEGSYLGAGFLNSAEDDGMAGDTPESSENYDEAAEFPESVLVEEGQPEEEKEEGEA